MVRRKSDPLIDSALQAWADWLLVYIIPPKERTKRVLDLCSGWDTHATGLGPTIRAEGTHSNPTLHHLVASECHGTSWALSIHALIGDMPKSCRIALTARAFDIDRAQAARYAGIKESSMSVAESTAISELRIGLAMIAHVRRGQAEQRRGHVSS